MIQVLKEERGFVYAYCEWWVCNVNGVICDDGEYCQVREMWIHPDYRPSVFSPSKEAFWEMILKMDKDPLMKSVKWVYWNRQKYDRPSKLYLRGEIVKRGESYGRKH